MTDVECRRREEKPQALKTPAELVEAGDWVSLTRRGICSLVLQEAHKQRQYIDMETAKAK